MHDGHHGVLHRPQLVAHVGDRHVRLVTVVRQVVVDIGNLQLCVHGLGRADQWDVRTGDVGHERHGVAHLHQRQHRVVPGQRGKVGGHGFGAVLIVLDVQFQLPAGDATALVDPRDRRFRACQVERLRRRRWTGHVTHPADTDGVIGDPKVGGVGHLGS